MMETLTPPGEDELEDRENPENSNDNDQNVYPFNLKSRSIASQILVGDTDKEGTSSNQNGHISVYPLMSLVLKTFLIPAL
ncbi:hypothetical protein M5689_022912 [Euphorbia peplus]|nr:hypothetical protein M5689_022912 [Euphorbia peplus]